MRLLIYGMQSSGASTFCFFAGQRPGSIAIIDVWARGVTPMIDVPCPVVAKATVTTTMTAADHIASFAPDRTILFVRNPVAVYASLINYPYANRFGRIEEKMARLEQEYIEGRWDAMIRYEDFVARDPSVLEQLIQLGWQSQASYWDIPRSRDEIRGFNAAMSPWCAAHFQDGWGFGNIKDGPIDRRFTTRPQHAEGRRLAAEFSPVLLASYDERRGSA